MKRQDYLLRFRERIKMGASSGWRNYPARPIPCPCRWFCYIIPKKEQP